MKSRSRTLSFILTTLVFLTGYGFFVFAAPPGAGGYDPGEILDPECTPGQLVPNPCIVKTGWLLRGNTGTIAGTDFIGTNDVQNFMVKTNGNQIALFGTNGNVAIGSANVSLGTATPIASGNNSFAWGTGTVASDIGSTAWGFNSTASASGSTVWGSQSIASGPLSTAWGAASIASGNNSTAFGYGSMKARSFAEVSFGFLGTDHPVGFNAGSIQWSDRLFSIGNGAGAGSEHNAYTMWKDGSFAYNDDNFQNDNSGAEQNMFYFNYGNHDGLGVAQTNKAIRMGSMDTDRWDVDGGFVGDRSIAFGFANPNFPGFSLTGPMASGEMSIAIGTNAFATNLGSVAIGIGSVSTGDTAVAIGGGQAEGSGSIAFGAGAGYATGFNSYAFGGLAEGGNSYSFGYVTDTPGYVSTRAAAQNSYAFGGTTEALGQESFAFGTDIRSASFNEFVFGRSNTRYTPISLNSFNFADRLFTVGNGDFNNESDAFTILKNGKTSIGYDNFETTTLDSLLQVNGSILSADLAGCDSLSSDSDGKILCSGVTNGLEMISGSIGLGGTLTQNTVITQGTNNFTVLQAVPSTGSLVMTQGLTTVAGFPGNVMGYIAANGDGARTISWASGASNNDLHTLSGSGDPDLLFGGAEIRTDYDITDTSSAMASLYAFDTPNGKVTRLQLTPTFINLLIDPTGELRINNNAGTAGYVIASNGIGVAPTWQDPNLLISDERLKSNVSDLPTDILSKLSHVRTVTYTLNTDQTERTQVGFLAQDLEQYFPELVGQKDATYKGVYYAQMTPVLVEAIRELNLQMTGIDDMAQANPLRDSFTAWLADHSNGIVNLYAEIVHSKKVETEQLCIKDVCMDRDQLYNVMQASSTPATIVVPPTPTPDPDPTPDPSSDPVPPETPPGDGAETGN